MGGEKRWPVIDRTLEYVKKQGLIWIQFWALEASFLKNASIPLLKANMKNTSLGEPQDRFRRILLATTLRNKSEDCFFP